MKSESQDRERRVLSLFPSGRLGRKVVEAFVERGYGVGVVELEGKPASVPSVSDTTDLEVVWVKVPDQAFWDSLNARQRQALFRAPVVIYHAGTDFLRLKSFGKDEEWRVDFADDAQRRFALVEQLVNRMGEHPPALWVNLAVGVTGVHGKKTSYCRTRYALLGFTQILHLNPAFRDTVVRNVCLSYFNDFRKGHTLEQCANCTTRELRDTLMTWHDEDDLVQYLVQESEAVFTRWPTTLP